MKMSRPTTTDQNSSKNTRQVSSNQSFSTNSSSDSQTDFENLLKLEDSITNLNKSACTDTATSEAVDDLNFYSNNVDLLGSTFCLNDENLGRFIPLAGEIQLQDNDFPEDYISFDLNHDTKIAINQLVDNTSAVCRSANDALGVSQLADDQPSVNQLADIMSLNLIAGYATGTSSLSDDDSHLSYMLVNSSFDPSLEILNTSYELNESEKNCDAVSQDGNERKCGQILAQITSCKVYHYNIIFNA